MASHRLRAGCMMKFSEQHDAIVTAGINLPLNPATLIVGKIGANSLEKFENQWLSTIYAQKTNGAPVILDFTDNHLVNSTELTPFYFKVLPLVDRAICSSELLRDSLAKVFAGQIDVVSDPIEVNFQQPKSIAFWPRTLLWFGHRTNLPYLANFFKKLEANFPIRLIVVSDVTGLKELERSRPYVPRNLMVEFRTWTIDAMLQAASESDICIIPSDLKDPRKSGVSSNRLLTALALGLPTIASRLTSYLPFEKYFQNIDAEDYTSAIINPCDFSQQVTEAQAIISDKHTTKAIADRWFSLI